MAPQSLDKKSKFWGALIMKLSYAKKVQPLIKFVLRIFLNVFGFLA